MELQGTIQVIAGNNKGFIIVGQEGWFNAADDKMLAQFKKGDEVTITYELNGKIKKVSMISSNGPKQSATQLPPKTELPKETTKPSSTGFACAICGKELKNGTFKKCYECNMAAKTAPKTEETAPTTLTGTPGGPKCVDCGIALKDNKYQKCFPCNQKNPVKKQWKPKSGGYDSPEKQAAIVKGNSLNAAAAILCGASCLDGLDPEGIAQVTKIVANSLLDYLKQD